MKNRRRAIRLWLLLFLGGGLLWLPLPEADAGVFLCGFLPVILEKDGWVFAVEEILRVLLLPLWMLAETVASLV